MTGSLSLFHPLSSFYPSVDPFLPLFSLLHSGVSDRVGSPGPPQSNFHSHCEHQSGGDERGQAERGVAPGRQDRSAQLALPTMALAVAVLRLPFPSRLDSGMGGSPQSLSSGAEHVSMTRAPRHLTDLLTPIRHCFLWFLVSNHPPSLSL